MAASEAMPIVRVICGPTAAGKTDAALRLARHGDVSIISADSRQLYRGFDIGTAKPTHAERAAVPHYGIDVLEPTMRASAAWWTEQADAWLGDVLRQGRTPLVVGGTGLYLRALFGGLFEEPPLDPERRLALQRALDEMSAPELRRWVDRIDPARAHLGRTQLVRAVEIALLTGRRLSELQAERRAAPRWRARYLVIDPGPRLAQDIRARAVDMLSHGWVDEVRALMAIVPPDAPAWNASGYGVIRQLVHGTLSTEAALERVTIETRQYAKRQRTWFRHQLIDADVTRVDVREREGERIMERWWHGAEGGA